MRRYFIKGASSLVSGEIALVVSQVEKMINPPNLPIKSSMVIHFSLFILNSDIGEGPHIAAPVNYSSGNSKNT